VYGQFDRNEHAFLREMSTGKTTTEDFSHRPGRCVYCQRFQEVLEQHHLLDGLASTVFGLRSIAGKWAIAYITKLGGIRRATVSGTRLVSAAVNEAGAPGHSHGW
jgi:hypothetical protein